MIDFEKFFLGEVGIIVRDESEAVEIIAACEEDGIEVDFTAGVYEKYPYWVVSGRELLALKTYQEAMEHVDNVYSYQTYAFDNQV
jgi:hypothetical protein